MGREQPVGRKVHVQHFGLDVLEGVLDAAVFRFQIKGVGSVGNVQVAVGVKAVHELLALVTQVAFDRQVQVEGRAVGDGVALVLLGLGTFELLFHADGAEVGDVSQLAGVGKSNIGLVRLVVIVSAVKIRVLGNHVTGHHFETQRLAGESRRTGDNYHSLHLFWVVDGPLHGLETAHGTAQNAIEFLDVEPVGQFLLGVDHVADGDDGEGAPVGLARAGIDCRGAGSSLAPAQDVAADHEEAVRVYGLARTNQFVPPAGFPVGFGIPAGGMGVGGQRRTNPHRVVGRGVQLAVSLVTDIQRRQRLSVFQHKTRFAIVLDEILGDHRSDAGFMRIFTHMHKYSKTVGNRQQVGEESRTT